MVASKIEQLIEDIYEFVESCKMQPLSSTKVIVPKDELYDLLDELRLRTPDEIKRYQKIISNRDAIISDAEEKANAMLSNAQERTNALIDEHEIMQQAYYQANEIVDQAAAEAGNIIQAAHNDAEQIQMAALSYTNDMLAEVENVLVNAYESAKAKSDGLIHSIKGNLDIIANNKREIQEQLYGVQQAAGSEAAAGGSSAQAENGQQYAEDDFNFDENKFLEDID